MEKVCPLCILLTIVALFIRSVHTVWLTGPSQVVIAVLSHSLVLPVLPVAHLPAFSRSFPAAHLCSVAVAEASVN